MKTKKTDIFGKLLFFNNETTMAMLNKGADAIKKTRALLKAITIKTK